MKKPLFAILFVSLLIGMRAGFATRYDEICGSISSRLPTQVVGFWYYEREDGCYCTGFPALLCKLWEKIWGPIRGSGKSHLEASDDVLTNRKLDSQQLNDGDWVIVDLDNEPS